MSQLRTVQFTPSRQLNLTPFCARVRRPSPLRNGSIRSSPCMKNVHSGGDRHTTQAQILFHPFAILFVVRKGVEWIAEQYDKALWSAVYCCLQYVPFLKLTDHELLPCLDIERWGGSRTSLPQNAVGWCMPGGALCWWAFCLFVEVMIVHKTWCLSWTAKRSLQPCAAGCGACMIFLIPCLFLLLDSHSCRKP